MEEVEDLAAEEGGVLSKAIEADVAVTAAVEGGGHPAVVLVLVDAVLFQADAVLVDEEEVARRRPRV